jgi:hypothetical protein
MRLERHPPLAIGGRDDPSGGSRLELAHARLWLRLRLPDESGRRDWHLHLVRSPRVDTEETWTGIDLARHPLCTTEGVSAWSDEHWHLLAADLERHLASTPVTLFLEPGAGLVSEPGESRAAFRRRLAGILRPAVQELVRGPAPRGTTGDGEGGRSTAPVRGSATRAAAELSGVLDGVVSTEGVSLLEAAISGELGPLTVGRASDLVPVDGGDRMIGHGRPIAGSSRREET